MRIALTGNPNSGKTTMYNALTGRNEKVGNWAGVTVDKKEHPIKKAYYSGSEQLIAVDLPGAYSMSPFTSEESITSSYVKKENPDAIINIVDATNLSRSLFFTTQLLELGVPVVVALNKSDINEKKGTKIDTKALSDKLGCPVINTVSISADGLKAVVEAAVISVGKTQAAPYVQGDIDLTDKKVVEVADRKRFEFVNKLVKEVETRKILTKDKNFGDKIDAVLTNKWLGIPIFAAQNKKQREINIERRKNFVLKMFKYLSEDEKLALNLIKKSYDNHPSKTVAIIEPKLDIKVKENVMISLQEKDYWEINRTDMGNHMEMMSITFKDKFFSYFNISVE